MIRLKRKDNDILSSSVRVQIEKDFGGGKRKGRNEQCNSFVNYFLLFPVIITCESKEKEG